MINAWRPKSQLSLQSLPAQTDPAHTADAGRLRNGGRGFNRRALLLLLIAHLALTVAYSALVPLGEAPDEADHWAYIVYLAQERRLPEGPAMTQVKHPPLYHATAALIASLAEPRADFLRANPDVRIAPADWGEHGSPNFFVHTALEDWPWRGGALAFHLARLWSALLSTLTVWATFGLLRAALPDRPAVAWAGAGLLAFLPEFAFIGGSANNDNLAALCGTLALWGGVAIFRAGADAGRGATSSENTAKHPERRAAARSRTLCVRSELLARPHPSTGRHSLSTLVWKPAQDAIVFRAGWWTPLALGAGLLAKVSTAALWPVVGIAILAGAWRGEKQRVSADPDSKMGRGRARINAEGRGFIGVLPHVFVTGLLVFLPALLIAAPWFWRNWALYGDLLGMALARQTVDVRAGPWTAADTAWLLRGWFISFWGKFGGAGHIPMVGWIYGLLGALTALAGAGLVQEGVSATRLRSNDFSRWRPTERLKSLLPRPKTDFSPPVPVWGMRRGRGWDERFAVVLLALAALLTALGIWQYSLTALGTDQGRLLYPAIGALAGLLALGWLAWVPPRWETRAAAALTLFSLALGLYGLLGVIRPAFAAPASAPPPVQSTIAPTTLGELTLLGATLDGEPILYWTAPAQPTQDWRVILRVVAEDGTMVWEWKRSPGAGRFSTDRWPAGYVMRDAYRVAWPEWAGPGHYRVEVAAYPFGGEPGAAVFVGWLAR